MQVRRVELLGAPAIAARSPLRGTRCPVQILGWRHDQRGAASVQSGMLVVYDATPNPICCGDSGGRAGLLTKPYKN